MSYIILEQKTTWLCGIFGGSDMVSRERNRENCSHLPGRPICWSPLRCWSRGVSDRHCTSAPGLGARIPATCGARCRHPM